MSRTNKQRLDYKKSACRPGGGSFVPIGDAVDEEHAILTCRRINRRVRAENAAIRNAERTKGLTTARLCPACRGLRSKCRTCGGRGVVPS